MRRRSTAGSVRSRRSPRQAAARSSPGRPATRPPTPPRRRPPRTGRDRPTTGCCSTTRPTRGTTPTRSVRWSAPARGGGSGAPATSTRRRRSSTGRSTSARSTGCIGAADGTERWRTDLRGPLETSLVVADGTVYYTVEDESSDGGEDILVTADASDGEQVWEYAPREAVAAAPVVVDGVVYLGTTRRLLALESGGG